MCHLDTAGKYSGPVRRIQDGDFIKTDGKTILGADDRTGMTIMLYMIAHNVPGRYCFFFGEEVGCVGSKRSSSDLDYWDGISRCVSFDRAGYSDVITHQCGARTASDEFATSLASALNEYGFTYAPSDEGVFTDSDSFSDFIPECTNLSVGYFNAHFGSECQDIVFLDKLCRACVNIDWEALPVSRDPSVMDYSRWNGFSPADRSVSTDDYFSPRRKGSEFFGGSNVGEINLNSFNPFSRIEMALIFNNSPDASDVREALSIDPDRVCELMIEYGVWKDSDNI